MQNDRGDLRSLLDHDKGGESGLARYIVWTV
jgi:hypothetical protein